MEKTTIELTDVQRKALIYVLGCVGGPTEIPWRESLSQLYEEMTRNGDDYFILNAEAEVAGFALRNGAYSPSLYFYLTGS